MMLHFKKDEIEIERPKKEDIASIEALFVTVLKDNWEKNGLRDLQEDLEDEIRVKKEFIAKDFATNGKEKFFLIAKVAGQVVGTIEIGEANETIKACSDEMLSSLPEIGTVFVLPEYQGKGIGSKMLEKMVQYLRNESYKGFCIDSGYKTAQVIWIHKYGEPTFTLKGHWGPDLDHMVWQVLF